MPAPTDPQVVERAYTMWRAGTALGYIANELGIPVSSIENWRSRQKWILRRDSEDAEAADGKRRKMSADLIEHSPHIMEAAIDLALHAESETVRAAQQRYLLGTLGFSPDTAVERIRQMEASTAKLLALSEPEVVDVSETASRVNDRIGWEG